MGKANIKISCEFLQMFLQLPKEWKPISAHIESLGGTVEPTGNLCLVVEGENIETKEPPIELNGIFIHKVIDGQDGRWIQGHWEIFR